MTQHINTGGPAFPCECENNGIKAVEGFNHDLIPAGTTLQYRGLTMRDWFAGKAMREMSWDSSNIDACAKVCYEIADAMLRAREGV